MQGPAEAPGVIPHALTEIFQTAARAAQGGGGGGGGGGQGHGGRLYKFNSVKTRSSNAPGFNKTLESIM
jgi:hypothetical protein